MNYVNILSFIISIILSYIGTPMILYLLKSSRTVSLNYRNEEIPICMGLLFIFVQIITIGIILALTKFNNKYILSYLFALTLMGMVGLLDDLIGDNKIKGFKGHIKSFFKGILTTGGIKAGIGFFLALFISIIESKTLINIIVNTFVIALFTNLINLFDLRPGRAIKVFTIISIIMLITSNNNHYNFILYSLYGILVLYSPLDLKAKAMMGDVGSNVLGITLGIYSVYTHNFFTRLIYLFALIVIHILAEKLSFSKVIENNSLLKFIDNLGR